MLQIFKNKKNIFSKILFLSILFSFIFTLSNQARASIIDDIKARINQTAEKKKQLEEEIEQTKNELQKTENQAQSLKKDINDLTTAKKKLDTTIKTTEVNIEKTSSSIKTLSAQIEEKEESIIQNIGALKETIKSMQNDLSSSPVIRILGGEKITDFLETNENFQEKVSSRIEELKTLKAEILSKKNQAEVKKNNLSHLKTELSGQKVAVVETQKQKDNLLTATKNQEANYKKILEEKQRLVEEFEKELFAYESELKIAIDPSKLPEAKKGVLSWPLSKILVTQYFGATVAAKRLYVSGTHNGIDLAASDGTPVKAALSGVVQATGNTDTLKSCYSYGKWILLKHYNGISTLYAHLSSVALNQGDEVITGDTIGYSGRTGYVTGPHLHFTVLASEGVRVMAIPSEKSVNCRGIIIPLADTKAFLDPILYLPR